jgi:hypothetical protein
MLVSPGAPPSVSSHFSAAVVWLNATPLQLDRTYLVKHTTRQVKAKVRRIHYRVDVNTMEHESVQELDMNGIAVLELETSSALFFDGYHESRTTGSFILMDPLSNATVGAGMIREDLSKPQSQQDQPGKQQLRAGRNPVSAEERIDRHGHRPSIVLLPDDLAAEVADRALFERGFETIRMDARELSLPSLVASLSLSWSAGLLVLLVSDHVSPETRRAAEAVAGASLFELSGEDARLHRETAIAQILSHADTLRVQKGSQKPGKAN